MFFLLDEMGEGLEVLFLEGDLFFVWDFMEYAVVESQCDCCEDNGVDSV
jgi:hypothetical protein